MKDIIGLPGRWEGDVYQYDMVQIFEERKAALAEIERLRATLRYRTLALRTIATVYNGRPADIAKEALDGPGD